MSRAHRTRKVKLDYVITIPTYQRVNLFYKKTYSRIIKPYKLESKVLLLIQTDNDAKQYKERMPELKQLRTPKGLLETVNYVASTFPKQKPIVMMHDDVTRLLYVKPPCVKRFTVKNADVLFRRVFRLMKQNKCHLGGLYPTNNPLSMVPQPAVTTNLRFIHDPVTFMYNQNILLHKEHACKMDFERTILYYQQDHKILRMNHYGFATAYNPTTAEGGFGYRDASKEKKESAKFVNTYGKYINRVIVHKDGTTSFALKPTPPYGA